MRGLKFLILILISGLLVACKDRVEPVRLYPAYENIDNIKTWGYIDEFGSYKIKPRYNMATDFSNNLAIVEKDGLFGLINSQGLEILKPEFTKVVEAGAGYFIGYRKGNIGIYSEDLPIDLGNRYFNIGNYGDGYFTVTKKTKTLSKFGYIDKKGREVISPKYDLAYDFYQGRALVKEAGNWKIINKKAKILKELNYEYIRKLEGTNKFLVTTSRGLVGLMDEKGELIIEPNYNSISILEGNEDYIIVGKALEEDLHQELYGLLDSKGKAVLDFKYKSIRLLPEAYVALSTELGHKGGYLYTIINSGGEKITEEKYYDPKPGGQGFISVYNGEESFLIDLQGERSETISLPGRGEIIRDGNIFKTIVDDQLLYYNMKEEIIWEADKTFYLNNGIEALEKSQLEEPWLSIKYPYFIGFKNRQVQEEINQILGEEFLKFKGVELTGEDFSYYKTVYSINESGGIVRIEKTTRLIDKNNLESIYRNIYNIDLETGYFYSLKDLVNENKYGELNDLILEQLQGEALGLVDGNFKLDEDTNFKIEGSKLTLALEYRSNIGKVSTAYVEFDLENLQEILGDEGLNKVGESLNGGSNG